MWVTVGEFAALVQNCGLSVVIFWEGQKIQFSSTVVEEIKFLWQILGQKWKDFVSINTPI
jgi:hypothetical protein